MNTLEAIKIYLKSISPIVTIISTGQIENFAVGLGIQQSSALGSISHLEGTQILTKVLDQNGKPAVIKNNNRNEKIYNIDI